MAEGGHKFVARLAMILDRESVEVQPRFVIAEDFKFNAGLFISEMNSDIRDGRKATAQVPQRLRGYP